MCCDNNSERLIELSYGELSRDDAEELESHLAACEACRREWEAIRQNGELLDLANRKHMRDVPSLDPADLFAAQQRSGARQLQRWKHLALAATAAAMLLAVTSAAIRRIEIDSTHVTIRWQESPAPPPSQELKADAALAQFRAELAETRHLLADHRQRLDNLDQLAALIVTELKDDDARFAQAVAALHVRIDVLRRQNDQRWQAVGRGFHDWYLTQRLESSPAPQTTFVPLESGESP
jgi:hypothetical protein